MELYSIYNGGNNSYPVVISVPHSGRYIPGEIRSSFTNGVVLTNMDWYLDIFYEFFKQMGVTTIIANYSRYVIDLNRGLNLQGSVGDYKNTLVYNETTFGKQLYKKPLTENEITKRIEYYYVPFYERTAQLLKEKISAFKRVYFFDMHSFFEQADEDICLSNADNVTSEARTIAFIENELVSENFTVDKNSVFKGGRLIRHFNETFNGAVQCIAIEISYDSYLGKRYFGEEEVSSWDKELFEMTQNRMKRVFINIINKIESIS